MQSFEIFLNQIYESLLLIDLSIDEQQQVKSFKDKVKYLRKEYQINSQHGVKLVSLYKARNCITHRKGLIGQLDIKNSTYLKVEWFGVKLFLKGDSGTIIDLPEEFPKDGIIVKKKV